MRYLPSCLLSDHHMDSIRTHLHQILDYLDQSLFISPLSYCLLELRKAPSARVYYHGLS